MTASDYGRVHIWDADDRHEYDYVRIWDDALPILLFVMLNPASGDAASDTPDATTRRCVGYAKREGCGGIRLINLFTFRATYPSDLWAAPEPVGPRANDYLKQAFAESGGRAVVGWGAIGGPVAQARIAAVQRLAAEAGCQLLCVRVNHDGSPAHPSRGAYKPLQPWPA